MTINPARPRTKHSVLVYNSTNTNPKWLGPCAVLHHIPFMFSKYNAASNANGQTYLGRVNYSSSHQILIFSSCSVVTILRIVTGEHLKKENVIPSVSQVFKFGNLEWYHVCIPSRWQHFHWRLHFSQLTSVGNSKPS